MRLTLSLSLASLLAALFVPGIATACSDNEYEYSLGSLKGCAIKGPDILHTPEKAANLLSKAFETHDMQKIYEAVGVLILNGTTCIGCKNIALEIRKDLTENQLAVLVGQGFFTLIEKAGETAAQPTLINFDPIRQTITPRPVVPVSDVIPLPPVAPRAAKHFKSFPDCLVEADHKIYSFWVSNPRFVDDNNDTFYFPNIDLREDDTISVRAVKECTELNSPKVRALKYTDVKFQKQTALLGTSNAFKIVLIGVTYPH